MDHRPGRYRNAVAIFIIALLACLAAASFLPLVETNIWWIRYLDFPRVQLAVSMFILLVLYFVLWRRPHVAEWIALIGAVAALGYHAYKLHPYSELVEPVALTQSDCREGHGARIMIANVKRNNKSADAFLDQVAAVGPDLLLILETDAWWHARLEPLHGVFRHRTHSIPEDESFFGMHLFSKLELISPEFRFFFGADTPTAVTQLRLTGGDAIGFIGLHPNPPLAWSQPTTMRDAHILQAALIARSSDAPTIVAGDFNAVPWERVARRAMRIGGLLDPRIGRGFYPTHDTESFLIHWPIDQILFQPQFTLQSFGTLKDFGSDHFAVVATLCHEPAAGQHAPELLADDLAETETSIETARRAQELATD